MRLLAYSFLASLGGCLGAPGDAEPDGGVPHGKPEEPTPATDAAPGAGEAVARRAFVTRGVYTADFGSYLDTDGGLAAADALCQLRADAAELGGVWRAWLSSSTEDAIDRIEADGPWELIGGQVVFQNRAALQTEPLRPLDRDEHGSQLDDCFCGRVYMWTGTRVGGHGHEDTCSDWTASTGVGRYGQAGAYVGGSWTDYLSDDCGARKHLLCLEQ